MTLAIYNASTYLGLPLLSQFNDLTNRSLEPSLLGTKRREWAYVSVLFCGVLLSRASAIRFNHELNLDESLMLAQASRYAHDIVPWRSVDGATSGPVNTWALLLAHSLGMPFTYTAAHLFASMLLGGTVPLLYLAARSRFGVLPAGVAAASEAMWIILSQNTDFIHYSSELIPIFLISASLALGERGLRGIAAAFLLGIVPWAKLQAAPIAFAVGLWMLFRVIRPIERDEPKKRLIAHAFFLTAAGLAFSCLLLILVFAGGAQSEMWNSYFIVTKYYSGSPSFWTLSRRLALFYGSGAGCAWFGILVILRLCLGRRANSDGKENSNFSWLLTILSAYACVRPGFPYDHYLLLMLPSLVILTAASFVEWTGVETSGISRLRIAAVALLVFAMPRLHEAYYRFRTHLDYPSPEPSIELAAAIHRADPTARSLTIWGWFPSLYIETGLPPSTRFGVYHFLTLDTPSRDLLRKSFMEDLLKSDSDVFFEGGPIPLSSFPELEAYVHSHFASSQQLQTPSGTVSLYVRNSRSSFLGSTTQ